MFPQCVCVCAFRCGMTLWLRQLRTGLRPACGSMGRLTSSGSWVRTSPSGQDGEWLPLWLPAPLADICCSSQGGHSLSSHGRCLASPFFFLLKVLALWPSDCLRNAPVTAQINKRYISSNDPWGQKAHPFSGSWLSVWKRKAPLRVPYYKILLRNNKGNLRGMQFMLTVSRERSGERPTRLQSDNH